MSGRLPKRLPEAVAHKTGSRAPRTGTRGGSDEKHAIFGRTGVEDGVFFCKMRRDVTGKLLSAESQDECG